MKKNLIVSLGRQYGSGGRQLGKRLAELLGIRYLDKELLVEMILELKMQSVCPKVSALKRNVQTAL